jgi:hypothetical protein
MIGLESEGPGSLGKLWPIKKEYEGKGTVGGGGGVDMLDNAVAIGVKFGTVNGKCTNIFGHDRTYCHVSLDNQICDMTIPKC